MPVPQIDFSPLGDLPKIYREAQQQRAREQVLTQLGQGSGPLDYSTAARQLLSAGDTEGALSLARLAQQQYVQSPAYAGAVAEATAKVQDKYAPKTANIKTPSGDEITVEKGPGGYRIPVVQGMPEPTPNPLGLTGEAKREYDKKRAAQLANIDDKAVLEADKAVQAGNQAKFLLGRAIELNETAFAGPFAKQIGYGASLFGSQAGIDTEELHNTVTNQALENLRAIFGGNPTEGERKVLLDVQGAPNQAAPVRERIYRNAMQAADARVKFNERLADEMRGGRYLLPSAQRQQMEDAAAGKKQDWLNKETITAARANPQATLAEARGVIAKNPASRETVIQRLRQVGIDPAGL